MDRNTSKQSRFTTDPMDSAQTPISLGSNNQHLPHQTSPRTTSNPSPRGINHPDPRVMTRIMLDGNM